MNENKYLYSVARVRALETKLLDRNKVERIIDAKDVDEVFKILSETDYSSLISELDSIYNYENMLSKELQLTYKLILEICPKPDLINIFLYKYDFHNLKTLIKSNYLEEDFDYLLVPVGTINVEKMKLSIKEKDYALFGDQIKDAIIEINNEFSIDPNPQIIDIVLDNCMYKLMYSVAKKSNNKFLIDYISTQIDLLNIKTFARIKSMGFGREFLKKVILTDGSLSIGFFEELIDEPIEILSEKLNMKSYSSVLNEGLSDYSKTKRLTKYEKLADDFLFDLIKRAKYIAFGVEPLVGYLMAKENEVKIIRMILVGKINRIPNEIIRERLRDVYV